MQEVHRKTLLSRWCIWAVLTGVEEDLESADVDCAPSASKPRPMVPRSVCQAPAGTRRHHRADGSIREVCDGLRGVRPHDRGGAGQAAALFLWNREILEGSPDPLVALRQFLTKREQEQEAAATDW